MVQEPELQYQRRHPRKPWCRVQKEQKKDSSMEGNKILQHEISLCLNLRSETETLHLFLDSGWPRTFSHAGGYFLLLYNIISMAYSGESTNMLDVIFASFPDQHKVSTVPSQDCNFKPSVSSQTYWINILACCLLYPIFPAPLWVVCGREPVLLSKLTSIPNTWQHLQMNTEEAISFRIFYLHWEHGAEIQSHKFKIPARKVTSETGL